MSLHRAGHENIGLYSIRIITSYVSRRCGDVAHGIKENDDRLSRAQCGVLNGTARQGLSESVPCSPPLLHLRGWHNCALKHAFTVLSAGLRHNTKLYHTRRFNTRLEG